MGKRTSLKNARAQHDLAEEIWLRAVSDAYGAKDAQRRLAQMPDSKEEVLASYFKSKPSLRRWYDQNVEAGTCAKALAEFRSEKQEIIRSLPLPRTIRRAGDPDHWMAPFRTHPPKTFQPDVGAEQPKRRQGRPAGIGLVVRGKMLADVNSGEITLETLRAMKDEELPTRYGGGKTNTVRIRNQLVAELKAMKR